MKDYAKFNFGDPLSMHSRVALVDRGYHTVQKSEEITLSHNQKELTKKWDKAEASYISDEAFKVINNQLTCNMIFLMTKL